ncbi:MAG: hypothetical protein MUE98_00380 [Rhodobacteraceae bacterium]|jgi:hypothetical protein|nr:hypothetical protein [Paracoccaceae bacterium]
MELRIRTLLGAAVVLGLAACTPGTSNEFFSEAGAEVDEGGFGNPTMNNMMAQMASRCAGQAKGYIVPDPIVVRDPGSPVDAPRYRRAHVRCSGHLDGKYASVIYREYVGSAVEATTVRQADAAAN